MPDTDIAPAPSTSAAPAPSATPAPVSAPAASPASTPAPAASPKSALEAFEKHGAADSTQTSAPPVTAGDGRSVPPTSAATGAPATPGSSTPQGPIPFERHQAAIENARQKIREEYAWAQEYGGREEINEAVQRWRYLNGNPTEFLNKLAAETGYKVVPLTQPSPQSQDMVDPTDDLRADDGTTTLSGQGIRTLIKNERERLKQELMAQMAPALQYTQEGREQAQQAEIRAQAQDFAKRSFGEVSRMPHFNREGVLKEYNALTPAQRQEMGAHGALMTAYTNHLVKAVLPTLGATQEAKVIEDLRRSAVAGSTSAATASTQAPPTKTRVKDGDVNGLAKLMEQRWLEGAAGS